MPVSAPVVINAQVAAEMSALALRDPLVKMKPHSRGLQCYPRTRRSYVREGRADAVPTGILAMSPYQPCREQRTLGCAVLITTGALPPVAFPNTPECGSPHCSLGPWASRT